MRFDPMPYADAPGLAAVLAALPGTRLVGGCVRDALAGVPSSDIDLATPLTPDDVSARLVAAGLRAIPTGLAHGTVTALADGRTYEVTTLRRDVATDGRHATVAFTGDFAADAARRDFTINAISMTPDGVVFDYFGGAVDLAEGRVRFVGAAGERVREDYLRILRFFRFWTRYGRGEPDADAVAAIAVNVDGLAKLSVERVASELMLILRAPDPVPALRLMATLGVLGRVLGGTLTPTLSRKRERGQHEEPPLPLAGEGWGEGGTDAIGRVGAVGPDPLLRFAALTEPASVGVGQRLKLSGAELVRLESWLPPNTLDPGSDLLDINRALEDARHFGAPHDTVTGRIALAHPGEPAWERLRGRVMETPTPVYALKGRDLAALGIEPGPEMGRLLAENRAWWRDGGCVATPGECGEEFVRGLQADTPRPWMP